MKHFRIIAFVGLLIPLGAQADGGLPFLKSGKTYSLIAEEGASAAHQNIIVVEHVKDNWYAVKSSENAKIFWMNFNSVVSVSEAGSNSLKNRLVRPAPIKTE